jgi:hypothetical protein
MRTTGGIQKQTDWNEIQEKLARKVHTEHKLSLCHVGI